MTGKVIHHPDFRRPRNQQQQQRKYQVFLFDFTCLSLCFALFPLLIFFMKYKLLDRIVYESISFARWIVRLLRYGFFLYWFSASKSWIEMKITGEKKYISWTPTAKLNRTNVPRKPKKIKYADALRDNKLRHKTSILYRATRLSRTFCIWWKCQVNYNNRIELVSPYWTFSLTKRTQSIQQTNKANAKYVRLGVNMTEKRKPKWNTQTNKKNK